MKRYIVCIPQCWGEMNRVLSIPYSVMAHSPIRAAIAVLTDHHRIREYVNGEITVVEAKAGRLEDYHHFYSLDMILARMAPVAKAV